MVSDRITLEVELTRWQIMRAIIGLKLMKWGVLISGLPLNVRYVAEDKKEATLEEALDKLAEFKVRKIE